MSVVVPGPNVVSQRRTSSAYPSSAASGAGTSSSHRSIGFQRCREIRQWLSFSARTIAPDAPSWVSTRGAIGTSPPHLVPGDDGDGAGDLGHPGPDLRGGEPVLLAVQGLEDRATRVLEPGRAVLGQPARRRPPWRSCGTPGRRPGPRRSPTPPAAGRAGRRTACDASRAGGPGSGPRTGPRRRPPPRPRRPGRPPTGRRSAARWRAARSSPGRPTRRRRPGARGPVRAGARCGRGAPGRRSDASRKHAPPRVSGAGFLVPRRGAGFG